MITVDSGMAVIGLADELAQKGCVVVAKPNTILSELMRNTSLGMADMNTATSIIESVDVNRDLTAEAVKLNYATTGRDGSSSLHDVFLENAVQLNVKSVLSHISFAKNVAAPLVGEFADMIIKALAATKQPLPSESFSIETLILPEVMADMSFMSEFSSYKGKTPLEPRNVNLKLNPIEDFLSFILTGDKDVDKDLSMWYSRKGEAFLRDITHHLVSTSQVDQLSVHFKGRVIDYKSIQGYNVFDKADIALALYLIATKLFDSPDMSKDNASLNTFRSQVAEIRDFAGALMASVVEQATRQAVSQTLVIESLPDRKTLRVHGENYRKWLEQGGEPETLLGLLVSGKAFFTAATVDNNVETLKKSWNDFCLFENTSYVNRSFDNFKIMLGVLFREIMGNLSETELEYVKTHADYHSVADHVFDAVVDDLRFGDMQDIHGVALRLICRARFHYTDAEKILYDIQQASIINPDIKDVREAALVATVNYIVDYVSDQLALAQDM